MIVRINKRQQAAFVSLAVSYDICCEDDLAGFNPHGLATEVVATTNRGFQFLLAWLKARAVRNLN